MRRPVEKVPVQTTPLVIDKPASLAAAPVAPLPTSGEVGTPVAAEDPTNEFVVFNPGEIGSAGELVAEPPIDITPLVTSVPRTLVAPALTVKVVPGNAGGERIGELVMPAIPAPERLLVTIKVEFVGTGGATGTVGEVTGSALVGTTPVMLVPAVPELVPELPELAPEPELEPPRLEPP